jgi:hypothetical protein
MAQEEEFPAWELPGQAAAASHVVRPLACARLLPAGSPRQCPECQAYWHSSLRKVHRTLVSEEQVAKRDAAAAGPSSGFPISKLPREVLEERQRNTSKELQMCKAKLKYRGRADTQQGEHGRAAQHRAEGRRCVEGGGGQRVRLAGCQTADGVGQWRDVQARQRFPELLGCRRTAPACVSTRRRFASPSLCSLRAERRTCTGS